MSDYTDLKARLGRVATLYGYCTDDTISANTSQAAAEAAAAIDALEAEVARLRGVLQSCPPTSNPTVSAQYHLDRINAWWRLEASPALTTSG